MERAKAFSEELRSHCKENNLTCFTIVGDKGSFDVNHTCDYNEIGETLYFALCEDPKLLEAVSDAVRAANDMFNSMDWEYPNVEVGEVIETDRGEKFRCIGKDENGVPQFEEVNE